LSFTIIEGTIGPVCELRQPTGPTSTATAAPTSSPPAGKPATTSRKTGIVRYHWNEDDEVNENQNAIGLDAARLICRGWVMFFALIGAGFFSLFDQRIRPEGPFISIISDIIPMLLCLAVMSLGVISVRLAEWSQRIIFAFLLLGAVYIASRIIERVMLYWLLYGKGNVIGL
jgi:hypothetical protein